MLSAASRSGSGSSSSLGTILPIVLVALPWTRNIRGIVIAAVLVVIAMWIKRRDHGRSRPPATTA